MDLMYCNPTSCHDSRLAFERSTRSIELNPEVSTHKDSASRVLSIDQTDGRPRQSVVGRVLGILFFQGICQASPLTLRLMEHREVVAGGALRLLRDHQRVTRPRGLRRNQCPWRDGRCVQGSQTCSLPGFCSGLYWRLKPWFHINKLHCRTGRLRDHVVQGRSAENTSHPSPVHERTEAAFSGGQVGRSCRRPQAGQTEASQHCRTESLAANICWGRQPHGKTQGHAGE